MRYFLDTEFIEDGKTIDLLSIGIVAEDGREFYAESDEADLSKASDWVRDNVIAHLWHRQKWDEKRTGNTWSRDGGLGGLMSRKHIARVLLQFIGDDKPEFWAYYADYDWVVLCQLFGRMIDLPKGWPMYCNDLKQYCVSKGDPRLTKQDGEHHALNDARWVREQFLFLRGCAFVTDRSGT